jgi:hypothetical protein
MRLSRTFMPSTMAYRSGPLLWMTLPHMVADIATDEGDDTFSLALPLLCERGLYSAASPYSLPARAR